MSDARIVVKAAWERDYYADLVAVQISDLAYGNKLQIAMDSLLTVRTGERDLYKEKNESNVGLYQGAQKETKIVKRQKKKWVVIALGGLTVAIVELVVMVAQATPTRN